MTDCPGTWSPGLSGCLQGPGVHDQSVPWLVKCGEEDLRLNHGESESVLDRSCYNVIPEANKL